MIFYFTATGNSKHVAESIASEGETLVSIPEALENGQCTFQTSDERVGIISPTNFWSLPSLVEEFLNKLTLQFEKRPYLYYVATYGTTSGASAAMADHLMKEKGLSFDACFDVKMPDTWTPVFDLSDPDHVRSILEESDREIKELKDKIARQITGKHMGPTTPYVLGMIGSALYNGNVRKTSHFTVTDACIGCGLCARKCPVHAITMEGGRPVWTKDKCAMCLGCLHRCPKFAIQHGKDTARHGQYVHPDTRV